MKLLIFVMGLLIFTPLSAFSEDINLDVYGSYKKGYVSIFVENKGNLPVTISGLFGIATKHGPLVILLKDKNGTQYEIQGVVDGVTTKDVYLPKGFIFGRSIKTSTFKLIYAVGKGEYLLKATYLLPASEGSDVMKFESEWIKIQID